MSDKIKIVIFGDHCRGFTAYGRLVNQVADALYEDGRFDIIVMGIEYGDVHIKNYYSHSKPYPVYSLTPNASNDPQAIQQLASLLARCDFDIFLAINDIWQLWQLPSFFQRLREKNNRKFVWASWFPVDQPIRKDWIPVIMNCDYPITMSRYGYDQLKQYGTIYHKVKIDQNEFYPLSRRDKSKERTKFMGKLGIPEDSFVFGFVGKNQHRKNIFDLVKTFKLFKEKYKNAYLYLHTEEIGWGGNIGQYCEEHGIQILIKLVGNRIRDVQMNVLYNNLDCLIVPSMAEGVCLPIYEAQLTDTPVIGVTNTSITEALEDEKGLLVSNSSEVRMLTIRSNGVPGEIELPVFDKNSMLEKMEFVYRHKDKTDRIAQNGMIAARKYQDDIPKWGEFFHSILEKQKQHENKMGKKREKRPQWIKTI